VTRKTYNKLVRDKIPEIIISKGAAPKTSILNNTEYRDRLKEKLLEEAKEVVDEGNDILNELADVLELVKSIGEEYGIEFSEIESKQLIKKAERGGFVKKILLEWVDE
jgi:predicted house-cleaning noncanonical NTP pyrophosphatase (MazG superfamily)